MKECNFKDKKGQCLLTNSFGYYTIYECPGEKNCILFMIYEKNQGLNGDWVKIFALVLLFLASSLSGCIEDGPYIFHEHTGVIVSVEKYTESKYLVTFQNGEHIYSVNNPEWFIDNIGNKVHVSYEWNHVMGNRWVKREVI